MNVFNKAAFLASCLLVVLVLGMPAGLFGQSNTFPSSGNVGIGTTNPTYQFTIRDSTIPALAFHRNSSYAPNGWIYFLGGAGNDVLYGSAIQGYNGEIVFYNDNTPNNSLNDLKGTMTINSAGNVGIGTSSPTELLTVNGTTKTKEVIVEENVGADFVFADEYTLPSFSEVEQYIQAHRHLPEIPSAQDMVANGVKVGELQMKLLEKIEELTLYVIEQEKSKDKLIKIISELLKRIERIEVRGKL